MTEKFDYNSKTYIGASDEDIKIIHLVLVDGKRLMILSISLDTIYSKNFSKF